MVSSTRATQTQSTTSATLTVTVTPAPPVVPNQPNGILRLRGGPRSQPQVAWTEDVVDNEGAGKKKSKICCIYRKPRAFDESSSESESDSDDAGGSGDEGCSHGAGHGHGHSHSRGNKPIGGVDAKGKGKAVEKARSGDANAYEKGFAGGGKS